MKGLRGWGVWLHWQPPPDQWRGKHILAGTSFADYSFHLCFHGRPAAVPTLRGPPIMFRVGEAAAAAAGAGGNKPREGKGINQVKGNVDKEK